MHRSPRPQPPSFPLALVAALVLLGPSAADAAKPKPQPTPAPRMDKLGRVKALEDARSLGGPELEALLRDPDRSVRRRAALAAGRIGDAAVVPVLVEMMNDQEPEVRQMSAFALGLIGDKQAVERLVASLKDAELVVRTRSAEALGRIGDPRAAGDVAAFVLGAAPQGAPVVTIRGDDPGNPTDPWNELRSGLVALAGMKDAKAAESVLLLQGKPRFDWWAATWTAMRLELPSLKPVLLAAASSNDPMSRAIAVKGLGTLKDPAAFEVVEKLVRDPSEAVAATALKALGVLGDARGAPVAASMLASPNPVLRREALRALAVLPGDRTLRARIVPHVGAREPWIRGPALRALARADRDEFALVLSGLDPDPDPSVRMAVAQALGDVGGEIGASLLLAQLKEEDPRVTPSVLEALRTARGPDAAESLRRHLEASDFAVRAAAAEGLTALKLQGLTAPLLAAYRKSLSDADLDARLAQVEAVRAQTDPAAREALLEIVSTDPVRTVRARAAAALKSRGETSVPDVGPEHPDLAPADYRLAMEPYELAPGHTLYSPRAIVHTKHGKIEIVLDVVETPLTTASFMELALRGFYDGLTFHRVEPNFVVQGGCPRGDGNGGPGYTLRCELAQRPYGRGAVGMALSGKDTGGSQFFITHSPQPHLDGGYTLFGQVTSGMEVVDQIRPGDVIERVEIWTGR